jgi:sulfur carrier protein
MTKTTATISCVINGARREFADAPSISEILTALNLAGRKVAVEKNGAIVPKSRRAEVRLADGDNVEIVAAVGGG